MEMAELLDKAFQHLYAGRSAQAEELCSIINAADPNQPGSSYILGLIAHQRGKLDEAIELMRRVIALKPTEARAYNNLGVMLCQVGNFVEGIAAYKHAIALRPDYATAHNNLGGAYTNTNMPEEAVAQCQIALRLHPEFAEAHNNLAGALHRQGKPVEAVAHFASAVALKPNYAEAMFGLCMAELPILYTSVSEIAARRAAYEGRLLALTGNLDGGQIPSADLANALGTAQPFQLAYQGYNDRELQQVYGRFVCELMAEQYPPASLTAPPAPGEQIRVGIVSGFFRRHSNWKIPIRGWISQLDRVRFNVLGFYTGNTADDDTVTAAKLCDHFFQGPKSIDAWRQTILAHAPHVLIYPEVGMDPIAVKLAALRLAPVQCNSWGHPETSGFPTLDYFLSSELMEPTDGQTHYTEELVRLPNLSIFYEPLTTSPARREREDFGLKHDATVYWCGQSLFKYLPQFDHIYPQIARQVGNCQFVFVCFPAGQHLRELFDRRLQRVFEEHGLDFEDYCVLLPPLDWSSFSAVMQHSDIVLDTIGWSGCNSTLESLDYDLPIVTMPGSLMRGRHTMAILTMMGVTETIANSVPEYVAAAVRLARDPSWHEEIKTAIARNKHRVYYDHSSVAALANFLLRVTQAR